MFNRSGTHIILHSLFTIRLYVGLLMTAPLLSQPVQAQLAFGGEPIPAAREDQDIPVMHLSVDADYLAQLRSQNRFPQQLGYTIDTFINPANSGIWTSCDENGYEIWRMALQTDQFVGISMFFDQFNLAEGSRVFIYPADEKHYLGAFTNHSLNGTTQFAIQPVYTHTLIIQLEVPAGKRSSQLSINEIGFVGVDLNKSFGSSGPCNVNVNCSEGDNWQLQKNGVTRIQVKQGNSLYRCTGSLINNTRLDGTPYLLTAHHCGNLSSEADYAQWIFDFGYEAPDCENPLLEPGRLSLTGSQLIAHSPGHVSVTSDFKLILLNQTVPDHYQPFFNGWNRQNNISTTGVGIHHPSGDIKKISTFTTQPVSTAFGSSVIDENQAYWRLSWAETENGHGVTEGGSSGSPLFDADGRIVGALTGGSASCGNLFAPDFYGKFSFSWDANGDTHDRQLQPWLDPDHTGIIQLNGFGNDPDMLFAAFQADATEITLKQSVNFTQTAAGNISHYEWLFEGAEPASSTEENPSGITYSSYGTFDVQLVVSNEDRFDTLLKKDYVTVKPFLYPNPSSDGTFTLDFGREEAENIHIKVFDLAGRETAISHETQGANRITVEVLQKRKGLFIISIESDHFKRALKLIVL